MKSQNFHQNSKQKNSIMSILYLVWTFPLFQFIKIVGVYGSILNYLAWLFLKIPFVEKYVAGFGLAYYLLFFEIPLLFRRESAQLRKFTAPESRIKKTTRERGRETIEYARGSTKMRVR